MNRANIQAIAGVLLLHGETFHGGYPEEAAADWDKYGFGDDEVDEWCNAEVWDPSTANELRAAGMTPLDTRETSIRMLDENGSGAYTSGCPTYAVCNGDMSCSAIVEAWREMQ